MPSLTFFPESMPGSASLQGMTATLSQVLNESGPNGTGYHSSEENRCVRDNTALLVNNVAAIGGEEAVRVLCSCKSLVAILVDLLALHNDGPVVLKRFVGCFNHLSRSNKVYKFYVYMNFVLYSSSDTAVLMRSYSC